jgi:hypothetical protein
VQSFLSSTFAVLSNLLLSGVCNQCQSLQSSFSFNFCLINIKQLYALSVSVCSGVEF